MEVHILNGDALKSRLPATLPGRLIVMRECLVDGEPKGESLGDLFTNRITFLQKHYGISPKEYQRKTIPEIEQIIGLPAEAKVNLWFEDDLFCQVNLWFTAYLLDTYTRVAQVCLVRPEGDIQYGFGGMDQKRLLSAYRERQTIRREEQTAFSTLWRHYQQEEHDEMTLIADSLSARYPQLPLAVAANRERYPSAEKAGRPRETIKSLMKEFGDKQFGPIFREFSARESIYGYGDLQVKRLYDELKANA
jgi:hypothetical protein